MDALEGGAADRSARAGGRDEVLPRACCSRARHDDCEPPVKAGVDEETSPFAVLRQLRGKVQYSSGVWFMAVQQEQRVPSGAACTGWHDFLVAPLHRWPSRPTHRRSAPCDRRDRPPAAPWQPKVAKARASNSPGREAARRPGAIQRRFSPIVGLCSRRMTVTLAIVDCMPGGDRGAG